MRTTFALDSPFPTVHPKISLEPSRPPTDPIEQRSAVGLPSLRTETRQGGLQRGSSKQGNGAETRHTSGPNRRRTAQAHSQGDAGNRAPRWNHPPGRSSRLSALQAQRPAKTQELSPPHLGDLPRSANQNQCAGISGPQPAGIGQPRSMRSDQQAGINAPGSVDHSVPGSVGQDGAIQQHAEEEREQEDE